MTDSITLGSIYTILLFRNHDRRIICSQPFSKACQAFQVPFSTISSIHKDASYYYLWQQLKKSNKKMRGAALKKWFYQ